MTTLLTFVGAVAFVVSYQLARSEAADFLDGQLRQIALNAGDGLAEANAPSASLDPEDEFVIAIWGPTGEPLRNSPRDVTLPHQSKLGYSTIHVGGEEWRVYLASDARRAVQVAQRMSVREEMAEAAAIQAGAPILIAIPLMWLVIGWTLGQVMGRLTRLAGEIAERGIDNRELIPVIGVPAEVSPLVEAMNVLTNRLQEALERQKRFVSDAAHELRTPLAALQIQIDNLSANDTESELPAIRNLRGGVRRASALVEQLLRLARTEETTERARREAVDLCALVTQCVADFVPFADAKGVDLGMTARDAAAVSGWPDDLKMLFDNLIDNAIRYTPAGGSVDVSVRQNGESVTVEVLDTGCGVADADIQRLCDRFFRAAPIDVEGSGLGLAIAAASARQHDLEIAIENRSDQRGLRVLVRNSLTGVSTMRAPETARI
jgi:two-component system OmpR family sensor kinase